MEREFAGEEAVEGDGEDEGHVGSSGDVHRVGGDKTAGGAQHPAVVV